MNRIVIVGGGISGLSAAYYLHKAGIAFHLIEQNRLGGVIQTRRLEGCLLEDGPDSFLATKPAALELIEELGLGGQVISSNDNRRITYIVKKGRLVRMPDGLLMMVPTKFGPTLRSPLLSWTTKIRMGLEYFRNPLNSPQEDISVADFVSEHYGQEAVDYLAEPLLAGVYGGDPEKLSAQSVLPRFVDSAKKYGSLTKGILEERRQAPPSTGAMFRTLQGGMGQLTQTLSTRIGPDVFHGCVETIERSGDGLRLRVDGNWLDASHAILACPAYQASALLESVDPELAGHLHTIPYNSSITLSLIYDRATFDGSQDGFGFLVPKCEQARIRACTWVGTKFAYRVAEDKVLLRCFFGGEYMHESDEWLEAAAMADIRCIMGVTVQPIGHSIARWPQSMAQYEVGHQKRVAAITARLPQVPGISLIGNAYSGIGIPDCIRLGRAAAEAQPGLPGHSPMRPTFS